MANGSGDIKGSKIGLGIPNWFLELSGQEEPKVAAEGTKAGVPSSGYHSDRPLKPSADGFTHSGLWKCDSAVPDSVFPDQKPVTDAFNGLPQEIRTSALGKETEEKLQNSITTGDEKLFEEAKREIEILLSYYDYEVNVRQAAQRAILEHFPQGFPASQINFEFFVNVPNGLYNYEELARSAFVNKFRGLPNEKKAALYAILFALKSPGFTDDSLLENPLLLDGLQVTHAKYHELNRWIEERRGAFKAAELDGFLEKVKKTEEKEAQKDLLLNDSARERLEIGSAVQQLVALKRLDGHDNADTRAFLASVFTNHDNYLKGQESAKAEIEAAVTSPAQDFAEIFVGEAHASELKRGQATFPEIGKSSLSPFSTVETDRAIVRAALEKLAKDEELDPSILELAISFTKAEVKARLLGLAMQAGSAEVGGKTIDPVSEAKDLNLNADDSPAKIQKILNNIDLASLANSIDDSIKAVIEQEKLIPSMAGKEDIDKEWLSKRYQTLRENYTAARKLLDEGKTEEARARFLTLSNSPFAQSVNKEFSESLERSESIKFAGRIGIIVAAGVASSLAAGAAAPWLATTFDLSAGQLAAANLFISSAAFMGAEKTLSYATLNELPYNPDASTWENAGLLTIEYLETVGMFKFLGMGHKAYAQFVERALFRRAESQLVKEGMVKWGEAYTSEAARALVLERAELGIAGKILNTGGAFGAEYVSFSAWDLIVASGHYIAGDGSIDPTAVMSPEALEERGIFLFCLKLAGVIAMPITKPLHEVTARKILAKYKPQLDSMVRQQAAVLAKLAEYKKSGREDAGELKDIFKQLEALVKRRERLQSALVQSGMATIDQLAFTRSARKDAETLEPKLKLLKDLARLVTPKKANEWEYKPENREDVRKIIAKLIADHNAEVTEENGVYRIRLSREETLEIRPATTHDGAKPDGATGGSRESPPSQPGASGAPIKADVMERLFSQGWRSSEDVPLEPPAPEGGPPNVKWKKSGFSVRAAAKETKGPFVEVGGPTDLAPTWGYWLVGNINALARECGRKKVHNLDIEHKSEGLDVNGDVLRLPIGDGTVGVLFVSSLAGAMRAGGIAEANRVLEDGGLFVFQIFNDTDFYLVKREGFELLQYVKTWNGKKKGYAWSAIFRKIPTRGGPTTTHDGAKPDGAMGEKMPPITETQRAKLTAYVRTQLEDNLDVPNPRLELLMARMRRNGLDHGQQERILTSFCEKTRGMPDPYRGESLTEIDIQLAKMASQGLDAESQAKACVAAIEKTQGDVHAATGLFYKFFDHYKNPAVAIEMMLAFMDKASAEGFSLGDAANDIVVVMNSSLGAVTFEMAQETVLNRARFLKRWFGLTEMPVSGDIVQYFWPLAAMRINDSLEIHLERGEYEADGGLQLTLYRRARGGNVSTPVGSIGFVETDRGIIVTRYQGRDLSEGERQEITSEFREFSGGVDPMPWLALVTGRYLLGMARSRGKELMWLKGENMLFGYPHESGQNPDGIVTIEDARAYWSGGEPPFIAACRTRVRLLREKLEGETDRRQSQKMHKELIAAETAIRMWKEGKEHGRSTVAKKNDATAQNLGFRDGDGRFWLYPEAKPSGEFGKNIRSKGKGGAERDTGRIEASVTAADRAFEDPRIVPVVDGKERKSAAGWYRGNKTNEGEAWGRGENLFTAALQGFRAAQASPAQKAHGMPVIVSSPANGIAFSKWPAGIVTESRTNGTGDHETHFTIGGTEVIVKKTGENCTLQVESGSVRITAKDGTSATVVETGKERPNERMFKEWTLGHGDRLTIGDVEISFAVDRGKGKQKNGNGGGGNGATGGSREPSHKNTPPVGRPSLSKIATTLEGNEGYTKTRELGEYDTFTLKMPMGRPEDAVQRVLDRKGSATVLELGAGEGRAAAGLKKAFGDKVEIDNVAIQDEVLPENRGAFANSVYQDIDKIGRFPRDRYDLIISVYGGPYYAKDPGRTLEMIADHLEVGGEAVVTFTQSATDNIFDTADANIVLAAVSRRLGLEIVWRMPHTGEDKMVRLCYIRKVAEGASFADVMKKAKELYNSILDRPEGLVGSYDASETNASRMPMWAQQIGADAKEIDSEVVVGFRLIAGGELHTDYDNLRKYVQDALDRFIVEEKIPKSNDSLYGVYYNETVDQMIEETLAYATPIENYIKLYCDSIKRALLNAVGDYEAAGRVGSPPTAPPAVAPSPPLHSPHH